MPVKTVRAQVVSRRVVHVCGTPCGIKMFANGAMVVGFSDIYTASGYKNPAKTAGLKMGDVIVSIAGRETKSNDDVAAALQELAGAPAEVVYLRDGVKKSVQLTAVKDAEAGTWRTGMWVRDSSAGIGTLTFVDNTTGMFGGLGHSIHDVDTGATLRLLKGEVVPVSITGINPGAAGSPGELKGKFLTSVPMGDITVNGETGVYGTTKSTLQGTDMELALAQEITTGKAEIITTISGQEPQRYEVEIEKIALNSDDPNRNMVLRVTDKRLLLSLIHIFFLQNDLVHHLRQHLALGADGALGLEDARAVGAGDGLGIVGAVVGRHDHLIQGVGIVLGLQAVHQLADDGGLVAGSHHAGETLFGLGGGERRRFAHQTQQGDDAEIDHINSKSVAADHQNIFQGEKQHIGPSFFRFCL